MITLFAAVLLGALTHPTRLPDLDSLRVPILVYHNVAPHKPGDSKQKQSFDVPPDTFAAQMAYLHDHGIQVISLDRLLDALEGRGTVPGRSVVITFDDGWGSQYKHAYPVLRQYGFTATFFVFTNPLSRDDRFMTWDEVEEMRRAGMSIGSHTKTHPRLARETDTLKLRKEVSGSREILQHKLGVPVTLFAYPFGNFSAADQAAVRAAGYRAARAFPGGTWNAIDRRWRLRSMQVTENMRRFRQIVDPHQPVMAHPQ